MTEWEARLDRKTMDKERFEDIQYNLEKIRGRIRDLSEAGGRDPESVKLIAVSKHFPLDDLELALTAGQKTFGENRVQELTAKADQAKDRGLDLDWHMIGTLQTNKVKYLLTRVSLIHSVDRIRLLETIQDQAARLGIVQDVLLQVNVSGEASKGGFRPEDMREVVAAASALTHIHLRGLMTMAPHYANPEDARPHFAALRQLRDDLSREFSLPDLQELSMGMTNDYVQALEEGASMLRIGSAIFGPRQT